MKAPVPSLSAAGWITDVPQAAEQLLTYFFETMDLQTSIYTGSTLSLSGLLQKYGHDVSKFSNELESSLTAYFNRYFDLAIVRVTDDSNLVETGSDVTVKLYCDITDGNKTYTLGSLLLVNNKTLIKVLRQVNG